MTNFQCRFGRFLAWHSKIQSLFGRKSADTYIALPASRCKKSPFPLGKIPCTEINLGRLNPWILGACQPHCQEMADSRDLSLHIGFWWFLMLEYEYVRIKSGINSVPTISYHFSIHFGLMQCCGRCRPGSEDEIVLAEQLAAEAGDEVWPMMFLEYGWYYIWRFPEGVPPNHPFI